MKLEPQYCLVTNCRKHLADTTTPVSIYLKLRDRYSGTLLLESADYRGGENACSYICCSPLATFKISNNVITESLPEGLLLTRRLDEAKGSAVEELRLFLNRFKFSECSENAAAAQGVFGFTSYDAVQLFEDITFQKREAPASQIPQLQYSLFQYVIAIDHFRHEMRIFSNGLSNRTDDGIDHLLSLLANKNIPSYEFQEQGVEQSDFTDNDFLQSIEKAKGHIFRGDIFQIVLSRQFSRKFLGDDFNVYRALRSINPSPYLFYFDLGNFKIFGSSPEAQLTVSKGKAAIFPIAGTFRRTGDDSADMVLAKSLESDPKETSEHVMLVDLARNDLSRVCKNVTVETFKEIQFYSHVIHLVSKVTGHLIDSKGALNLLADTFPAGTLSGAPKYRAMELIDTFEQSARGFYGGCLGFIGIPRDGASDINHAIIIRAFLSTNNTLYYRAGAGIVSESINENELQEVNNKLLALKTAIKMAEGIR